MVDFDRYMDKIGERLRTCCHLLGSTGNYKAAASCTAELAADGAGLARPASPRQSD
jgi:hypothetical protein